MSLLQVYSDGYLTDVEGGSIVSSFSSGLLTIYVVEPTDKNNIDGLYYIVQNRDTSLGKSKDREGEELLLIIKSFILCQN